MASVGQFLMSFDRCPGAAQALGPNGLDRRQIGRLGTMAEPVFMERAAHGRTKAHFLGGTSTAPHALRPDGADRSQNRGHIVFPPPAGGRVSPAPGFHSLHRNCRSQISRQRVRLGHT